MAPDFFGMRRTKKNLIRMCVVFENEVGTRVMVNECVVGADHVRRTNRLNRDIILKKKREKIWMSFEIQY